MPSHIHTFLPGAAITCQAAADVVGGRLVEIAYDRAVKHASAGSVKVFGAAALDTNSDGDVLVLRGGVQMLLAAETVAAGDRVVAAEDGTVAPATADVPGIGLALAGAPAGRLTPIALDR